MSTERPNVLIIYVDQMRGDCLGAMGHPDLATPHLDRLAAEGVLFREAYTCYALCTPSRGAFMTGRYPHANGACGNHKPIGRNPVFLGQAFRQSGYETCFIRKLHLAGGAIPGHVPRQYRCGFEEFVGFNHGHDCFYEWIEWQGEGQPPPVRGLRTEQYVSARFEPPRPQAVNQDAPPATAWFYDREADPHELQNSPARAEARRLYRELDERLQAHMQETHDDWSIRAGTLPESGYMSELEGTKAYQQLVQIAQPDRVLGRWSGRVDRGTDREGLDLP